MDINQIKIFQQNLPLVKDWLDRWLLKKKESFFPMFRAIILKLIPGLGRAKPANLIILPVLFENKVKAVIELASLDEFSETHLDFLSQLNRKYRYCIEYH